MNLLVQKSNVLAICCINSELLLIINIIITIIIIIIIIIIISKSPFGSIISSSYGTLHEHSLT